jgi:phage I-like protein
MPEIDIVTETAIRCVARGMSVANAITEGETLAEALGKRRRVVATDAELVAGLRADVARLTAELESERATALSRRQTYQRTEEANRATVAELRADVARLTTEKKVLQDLLDAAREPSGHVDA